jgi:hypothetical protein
VIVAKFASIDLLVRNLPSTKMPDCDECKGEGVKDGYICTACKGRGTVEALEHSRRTDEVQDDIYYGVMAFTYTISI